MAAELSVCDVLCEAMEYLSKLGSNLRTRSESLKEKRISKTKLKNAHAVHKAANKVLLICELSKKSLDNVEAGVRKVLSIVDASQAHEVIGGKTIDKAMQKNKEKFYHFEFETHKLRISKKIPLKHYMSVQVLAKSMPSSMLEKYPVYYDCKLKRRRSTCENTITSICESDTNENTLGSSYKDSKKESTKDSNEKTNMREKTLVTSNSEVENSTSGNKSTGRAQSPNFLETEDAVSAEGNKEKTFMNLEHKNESENIKSKEDLSVSDLIECFASEAKVDDNVAKNETKFHDSENSKTKYTRRGKEATSIRKKFSKIRIADDSSESDDEKLKNNKNFIQKENISCKQNSDLEKDIDSEPKPKKIKQIDNNDTCRDDDSDNNSVGSRNSQSEQKTGDDDSKPIIRCVNITKLLKPDILGPKVNETNVDKNKQKKHCNEFDLNCKEVQRKKFGHSKVREKKNATENMSDDEFWALKRSEVKKFQPKKFTVNIERLPQLSIDFLTAHNLKRILQGCKTICEVTKEKVKEGLEHSVKNIDEVKNALLDDSASDDTDSTVRAESNKVKKSLLNEHNQPVQDPEKIKSALLNDSSDSNSESSIVKKKFDSDSEKEQINNSNQVSQDKLTDPAAIKDALLNESESENNDEQVVKEGNDDKPDSVTSGTKEDTDKNKSTLLNDSDSDQLQSKENDEIIPTLQKAINDGESGEHSQRDNDLSQNNKDNNVCDLQSKSFEHNEPVQDPEKIKSSLLNDSSDSNSESSIVKKKFKYKQKHARKSMKAKKMLLNYSSSSESEKDFSQESKKRTYKQNRRKSHASSNEDNGSTGTSHKSKVESSSSANEDKGHSQVDGTIEEHSNPNISQVRR